jgi:hypothetical protein
VTDTTVAPTPAVRRNILARVALTVSTVYLAVLVTAVVLTFSGLAGGEVPDTVMFMAGAGAPLGPAGVIAGLAGVIRHRRAGWVPGSPLRHWVPALTVSALSTVGVLALALLFMMVMHSFA